jgi:hypothetical protein
MSKKAIVFAAVLGLALMAAGCADDEATTDTTGSDLEIERRMGFAVVVDESATALMIGFNADRDAAAGESFDISQAVWRIDDGPWNEPPVTCVGRGQRVELGLSQVQSESQPGLLNDRVIWISCLAPPEEGG